jgi:hypothetical protein
MAIIGTTPGFWMALQAAYDTEEGLCAHCNERPQVPVTRRERISFLPIFGRRPQQAALLAVATLPQPAA